MRNQRKGDTMQTRLLTVIGPKVTITMGLEGHTEMHGPPYSIDYALCVMGYCD